MVITEGNAGNRTKQRLFTWGAGNFGQLGIGQSADRDDPHEVKLPFQKDKIIQIEAGH